MSQLTLTLAFATMLLAMASARVIRYPMGRQATGGQRSITSLQQLHTMFPGGFRIIPKRPSGGLRQLGSRAVLGGMQGAGLNRFSGMGMAGVGLGGIVGHGGLMGGALGGRPFLLDNLDLPEPPGFDSDVAYAPPGKIRTLADAARYKQMVDADSLVIG